MSKKKNIEQITEQMKQAGTYKPEFEIVIDTLAQTLEDYQKAQAAFKKTGGKMVVEYTTKTGAVNKIKNPEYVIVTELRESVARLCREVGITPAGLQKINSKALSSRPKHSRLEAALLKNGS